MNINLNINAPWWKYIFVMLFLCAGYGLKAQGDLLIYPKRIVFDGNKRSQDLSIINNGTDTARYVISVVQIRMKNDGSFENIVQPDSGQKFADKNFRFFPRSVVLGPREVQTVKVQLIQFNSLPDGEYRSHLYFHVEEVSKPMGFEKQDGDPGRISINIKPVYGISIPVIIRSGESSTEVGMSNLDFSFKNDSVPVLNMTLKCSGNMSIYGDISIDYISPGGKEIRVGFIKGVAVYLPTASRRIKVLLDKRDGLDYRSGSLHVVFKETSGKVIKIAQQQIDL